MERKVPFIAGECFHLYTRGVEKRVVFQSEEDYMRCMMLLTLCNSKERVHIANLLKKYQGEPLIRVFEQEARAETLVDVLSYALMPTHIHLIVRERAPGGISKFMLKLMTAYSMYFNTRLGRSGPLFTRPFRSKHIDSDEYFRWVFAYVHLNPLELMQSDWKKSGIADKNAAREFMKSYRYASFTDYFGSERPEMRILERSAVPIDTSVLKTMDELLLELSERQSFTEERPQEIDRASVLI